MWENVDVARVVPWTATSRDVSHNVTLLITGPQSQNIRHAATAVFLGGKLRNRINPILPGGGALCAPRVIKIYRLVTKSISNVMKLIENSSNTLPKLLVPFLAIFFGSGAC